MFYLDYSHCGQFLEPFPQRCFADTQLLSEFFMRWELVALFKVHFKDFTLENFCNLICNIFSFCQHKMDFLSY